MNVIDRSPSGNSAPVRKAASQARQITAAEAAALVKPGDWLDYGTGVIQPDVFDAALGARIAELSDIKVRSCLTMRPRAVVDRDDDGSRVKWCSLHFSGIDRRMHDAGRALYLPVNLGEIPDYYRRFMDPVDVVVFKTCPVDADGYFNLSASNLWHRAVIERAKIVIVETCAGLPYAHGRGNGIHISEVDYIIQGDDTPPPELANATPTDTDRAVARHIAAEVEDGSCLQIGIGGMPNAVCSLLLEFGAKDLGVHTEMMTDGLAALYSAGRANGARKTIDTGKVVYSFALGSKELYATIDRNPDLLCCPVEYTNMPDVIMQNERMVSINSTTQIDLQGQAASESDGLRHISGTGGQLQFVRGAYASKGGKSFICLPSTYDKRGERRSRIVLKLTSGNIVTAPRTDVMYVATEFGLTCLKGKTVAERALALIAIAHPDFREELEREAYENRIIPRGFTFSRVPGKA